MSEAEFAIPEGRMTGKFRWWNPLGDAASARLHAEMSSWLRTKHQEGQRAKRIGVDCIQLCPGIADAMFKAVNPTFVPRLQADAAMHDVRRGWQTVRAVRTMHYGTDLPTDGTIEPGDFIVTKAEMHPAAPTRAGHVIIAGVKPWTGLHAVPLTGVCWTRVTPATLPIIQIIRLRRKDLW